jgi:undecaprenyl-diphosphatase
MRTALAALTTFERRACVRWNRVSLRPGWGALFAAASRLGNGIAWYALIAAMPVAAGGYGFAVAVRMTATGIACTLLYTALKRSTRRERPCHAVDGLTMTVAPLDRFSFPSGHTMHAFAFTIVATAAFPLLGWVLVPFTVVVAASRLVLGLHWFSDVVAGAALGCALGWWGAVGG